MFVCVSVHLRHAAFAFARSGLVATGDATKLGWLLGEIRKTIETSDIELRIEQLEQQAAKK